VNDALELADDDLLEQFETARLPAAAFGHREHLRVGFLLLRRHGDFGEAALRFRRALRQFARSNGAEHKYHETLTWAYLALLDRCIAQDPGASFDELLRRHPGLLDHRSGLLARHYDVAAITACPVARRHLVLPERSEHAQAQED
jgi:hypothetical protein